MHGKSPSRLRPKTTLEPEEILARLIAFGLWPLPLDPVAIATSAKRSVAWALDAYVRYWHLADIDSEAEHVRLVGESGHPKHTPKCLFLTQSGHLPPPGTPLRYFDGSGFGKVHEPFRTSSRVPKAPSPS